MTSTVPEHVTEFVRVLMNAGEDPEGVVEDAFGGDDIRIECSMDVVVRTQPGSEPPGEDQLHVDGRNGTAAETEPDESGDSRSDPADSDSRSSSTAPSRGDSFECPTESCTRAFDTRHGLRIHTSKAHEDTSSGTADGGTGVPYKDPSVLREVYDESKSFAEMAEEIQADVSMSTVRRHMINHGIHEPITYNTTSEAETVGGQGTTAGGRERAEDAEESVDSTTATSSDASAEATDVTAHDRSEGSLDEACRTAPGETEPERNFHALLEEVGIERRFTSDDLNRVLRNSSTLHQTSQRLDIDKEQAKRLLMRMDLLDTVYGRLVNKEKEEVPSSEIDRRIRKSVSQKAT